MEVFVVIVVVIVAALILQLWLSSQAKRQEEVHVKARPHDVLEAVQSHFKSMWWRPVHGRGALNFQSKGFGVGSWGMDNPVISIDISEMDNGNTTVEAWMSSWSSRMGIVASCDRVYFKRRKLLKSLEEMGV
ncbi:hypothetical protein JWS13_04460 (plasmid) [Rhodococcus pseudokoreensis]|uniref:Pilin n=1 Tax=Rhodococcus pseudokoreensis TaxID=2811421 RepID=A0A974VZ51_9NOCA|nr:hypothetical protein [Rhodococcus pseudokoreensis]QSE87874.1 hypothetical protein JWS13_04460 [Rhodococcus pseudokoreensis]